MYLSFSGHKTYRGCPRAYYHDYISTEPKPPENRVTSLYGSAVGRLFEDFYRERMWRLPDTLGVMDGRVEAVLRELIDGDERSNKRGDFVDFAAKGSTYKSRAALTEHVRESIPRGVEIIRKHKLIGTNAEAEVVLDARLEGGHIMGGRADFIMTRVPPLNDVIITDGKGSKHRDKYTDPTQLVWYARQHQLTRGRLPDKVGFVYWQCEPENAVDWIELLQEDLDSLDMRVRRFIKEIEEGKRRLLTVTPTELAPALRDLFPTRPGSACRFCKFLVICPDGEVARPRSKGLSSSADSVVEEIGLD